MSNTTESKQLLILFLIGMATLIANIVALWIAPYLFTDDESALARFILLRVPAILMNVFVLLGSIVILDFLTDEDSLVIINQNPMAVAMLYSAMLVSVAMTIAFG